jgi:tRNA(fMet)-specific endonuclease VapC
MYLLDTNICIALMKNHPSAVSEFTLKAEDSYLSTIVISELYKGVYCSRRVEKNRQTLDEFIRLMPILDFDQQAASEFGKIQAELRKMGKPTGELDALIAAVARSHQFTLVTNNTRHFENITNLQLENWLVANSCDDSS